MFKLLLRAFVITLGLIGPAMAQERILISSDWGKVTSELVDNNKLLFTVNGKRILIRGGGALSGTVGARNVVGLGQRLQ